MKTTGKLFTDLRRMSSPEGLLGEEFEEIDFCSYIKGIMEAHHVRPKDLVVQLNMEKSYLYQILKGRRAPGREFLINFSILLGLNLDETQRLLRIAERSPLYPRKKRDAAAIYAITHKMDYVQYQKFMEDMEAQSAL